ncbi:hypothetical protein B7990_01160 [Fibrobacter sp. UWB4]|uniref:DUF4238 domain-containing protein n=1 Tax=Fibrobacter sp. UWB4 TaxID=1964356 RepID=UPI000B51F063|nr:DUF4238 domain-containing protein [Fibrobacter sp. UWB4]OWV19812.1 hypothetical protein B7990_01160 [Fibrobacter sp. UWB4]
MYNDVKKQHYVWEFYLKAWCFEGNKIWCNRNGNIFNTSTENIAQERRFYEITPLTNDEIGLIEAGINTMPKENRNILNLKLRNLIEYSLHSDNTRKNALECEYADMEQRTVSILQSIRKGSIDVLDNQYDKNIFSIFLGMQYTRTPKCRNGKINCLPEGLFQISDNFMFYWNYVFFSDAIGSWISSAKVSLLKNKTNIPFITGDQPVINIKSEYDNTPAKEIQLYYPISPKLALLFDEKELFENPISVDDVLFYNEKIKQASETLIIGNKKETVENV